MKQTITITGFEDSEDGTRTRFKTSAGWMSAFKNDEDTLIEDLKNHTNRLINVEVVASKKLNQQGKPYINIREFYGAIAGNPDPELQHGETEVPEKEEVPVEKIETVNEIKIADPTCSMYVSYVKDLIVSGIAPEEATKIVQQAKDAFS